MSPPFRFLAALRDRIRRRRRPEVRIGRAYGTWLQAEPRGAMVEDGPRISVLLPVYNTHLPFLEAAIASVKNQTYRNWELCIADDGSRDVGVQQVIKDLAGQDSRVKRIRLAENAGIAAATNAALSLASGDFVALLDHDDELAPQALGRVAAELEAHPETDVVFSDEDQLVAGRRCRPYFKPGWNPDLMLSQNLVSHLGVYRRALVERLGGMRPDFVGSQDYDLALRATSAVPGERIRHVPEVLYHWRQHDGSYSARRAAQCQAAARAALASVLGEGAVAEANPDIPQWTRIGYRLRSPEPLVSLIVPAGAAAPADAAYGALEVCGDDPERARGEVLVFWGKGLVPARAGWLRELVSQALRPEVGCAGPRLERPDGRIAHAGFVLHPEEVAQTLAPGSDAGDPGYLGHFLLCRTVSAVALAGMAVRWEVFMDLGGFDRRAGRFADVDFCLRMAERGLRCVWTPLARLRTRGLPRAGADAAGAAFMRERWGEKLARDPYANPNLVVRAGNLELAKREFKRVLF